MALFVGLGLLLALAWYWAVRTVRVQNAADKRLDELQRLSPGAFEEWAAARFRDLGYAVELTGFQGDHGVDLIATRRDERAVVQCKNYRAWSVGEPVLRDLFGAMHHHGADRAYLVTTGRLTRPAQTWVVGKPIEVWDGETLARLSATSASSVDQPIAPTPPPAVDGVEVPACPRCGASLIKRQNRRTQE